MRQDEPVPLRYPGFVVLPSEGRGWKWQNERSIPKRHI